MKIVKVKDSYSGNPAYINTNIISYFMAVNSDNNKVHDVNRRLMMYLVDGRKICSDKIFSEAQTQIKEEQFLNFLLSDGLNYFEF